MVNTPLKSDDGLDEERRLIIRTMARANVDRTTRIIIPVKKSPRAQLSSLAKDPKKSKEHLDAATSLLTQQQRQRPTFDDDDRVTMKLLEAYNKSIACTSLGSNELFDAVTEKMRFLRGLDKFADDFQRNGYDTTNWDEREPGKRKIVLLKWMQIVEKLEGKRKEHILKTSAAVPSPYISPALSLRDNDDKKIITKSSSPPSGKMREKRAITCRNVDPGEIIAVEKNIVTFTCNRRKYVYCSHCQRKCWSARTCLHCVHHIYCSAKCKEQAWKEYHEYECAIYEQLWSDDDEADKIDDYVLCGRTGLTFVRGFLRITRGIGGLTKLKEAMVTANRTNGIKSINYGLNDIYSFKVIDVYRTKAREFKDFPEKEIENWTLFACRAAYLLTRTSFFGDTCAIDDNDDNAEDERLKMITQKPDVLFVAALLLRSFLCFPFKHFHIYGYFEKYDQTDHLGAGIYPFSSYFNHSCNPNADYFVTADNDIVVFARQKIEKDSQIFIAYNDYKFTIAPRNERRENLERYYAFTCTCEACTEDWSKDILKSFEKINGTKYQYIAEGYNTFVKNLHDNFHTSSRQECLKYLKDAKKIAKSMIDDKVPILSMPYDCLMQYIYVIWIKLFGHRI